MSPDHDEGSERTPTERARPSPPARRESTTMPALVAGQYRVERKLGNTVAVDDLALQLRRKFPQSPETQALDAARYDD